MRKGVAATILIFFVLALSVITMANFLSIRSKSVTDIYMEDVDTLNGVLLLSKEYSSTALRFSLYQSCYDLLGAGKLLPDEAGFRKMLESSTESAMLLYTKDGYYFSGDYHAVFPVYNVGIEAGGPDRITVSMTGDDIAISKEYTTKRFGSRTISLAKNSSVLEEVPTDCWKVYQEARSAQEELKASISPAIFKEVKKWDIGVVRGWNISATTQEAICDALFNGYLGKTIKEAETAMKEEMGKMAMPQNARMVEAVAKVNWLFMASDPHDDGTVNASCFFIPEINVTAEISSEGTKEHPVHDGKELRMLKLKARYLITVGMTGLEESPLVVGSVAASSSAVQSGARAIVTDEGKLQFTTDSILAAGVPPAQESPSKLEMPAGDIKIPWMLTYPMKIGEWFTFVYDRETYRVDFKEIDIDHNIIDADVSGIYRWNDGLDEDSKEAKYLSLIFPKLRGRPKSLVAQVKLGITGPDVSDDFYVYGKDSTLVELHTHGSTLTGTKGMDIEILVLYPDVFTKSAQLYIRPWVNGSEGHGFSFESDRHWPKRADPYFGNITKDGASRTAIEGQYILFVYNDNLYSFKIEKLDFDPVKVLLNVRTLDMLCSERPDKESVEGCVIREGEPTLATVLDLNADETPDLEFSISNNQMATYEDAETVGITIRALR